MTGTLFAWPEGQLQRKLVTQSALSRVCGGCGRPLGRPIVFVGTLDEVARNEFHAPPLHEACVGDVRQLLEGSGEASGVVRTGGFEFVRPGRDDADQQVRFVPNSLL